MTMAQYTTCSHSHFPTCAAPSGVGVVSLVTRTSSSLTISWTTPTMSNGLVTRYKVTFNPVSTVGLATPTGGSVTVGLAVEEPEMLLLAVANGLQPATTYDTMLTAFTSGGSGGGPVTQLTTEEEGSCQQHPKNSIATSLRTRH